MSGGDWQERLQGWLKQHPLKTPPEGFERRFRGDVMARIRAEQAPVWRPRWSLEPRWALAMGGALAAALAVAVVGRSPTLPAPEIEQEAALLFEAGEVDPLSDLDLEGELREADRLVLAEAALSGASGSWADFENDLELLQALEEEPEAPGAGGTDRVTGEELLEELRRVDEAEMAYS